MKAFYGLEKGCKARRDGTGLTVRNVRIATSRLCEKAVVFPSVARNSITVTGCACYHGFSSSTTFDQGWQCCADGCDHQLFTLVYWQPWWKNNSFN